MLTFSTMKKLLSLSLLLLINLAAFSQTDFRCACMDIFAEKLEAIDQEEVDKLADHIGEIFFSLKAENAQFKTCSDHLSLTFSFWTKMKLNMFFSMTNCKYSETVKEMVGAGPLIYEMDFHVEKLLKEAHEGDSIQLVEDSLVSLALSADAFTYLNASYTGDGETFCAYTPAEYLTYMEKNSFMIALEGIPALFKREKIKIKKITPVPMATFLKQDDVYTTLAKTDVEFDMKGTTKPQEQILLAVSQDAGKHWKFIRMEREKLTALGALMDYINPFAIQQKFNDEKAANYPATSPEELGTYFCDCMNENKKEDFMEMIDCMNILKLHPLWEVREIRQQVFQYVKENCEKYVGNIVFSGLDRD